MNPTVSVVKTNEYVGEMLSDGGPTFLVLSFLSFFEGID